MATYISSDIHFNHLNVLKYCPHRWLDYDGFSPPDWDSVSLMNEKIISNWNSMITPDDEVWILGDCAMGKIENAPPLIRRLNGSKHLVLGNHDKTLHKLIKANPDTLSDLFVSIQSYKEISHKFGGKKHMICLSHFPMRFWNNCGSTPSSLHLHGHLHGSPCDVPGRIKDIGMDTNNLFPYLLDDVVESLLKIEVKEHHHGNL